MEAVSESSFEHDHAEEAGHHCCDALCALAAAAASLHRQKTCCHEETKSRCCNDALSHVLEALRLQTQFMQEHC